MKVKDVLEQLPFLKNVLGDVGAENEISGAYVSDLLSDVMANSDNGQLWLTLQTHQNVAAIASLKDLAGVIFVNNNAPDNDTLERMKSEGIAALVSDWEAYPIAGKLYALGIGNEE